jgi:hypothetical protein
MSTEVTHPMSEPMKQAWGDVAEGFSALGRLMKERYRGAGEEAAGEETAGDASADAAEAGADAAAAAEREREATAALRDAFERLVSAARELGDRAADVARDDDVKAQAKRAAANLNHALTATADMIGEEVGGWFKRSKPEQSADGDSDSNAPAAPGSAP